MRSVGLPTLGMVRRVGRQLVCIPTYNEASNILPLIEQVHEAAPDCDVLVIDDASPDGTGDLVRDRMLKDARLDVMARPAKLGLGTAYMAGFAFGLLHGYTGLLTMDSDFSHPPDRIPALIAAVDAGAHLAVGSRYVSGGAIQGWAPSRRVLLALLLGGAGTEEQRHRERALHETNAVPVEPGSCASLSSESPGSSPTL